METAKEIVIALLQYGYLNVTGDDDKNIETVKKAYDEIYKQLISSRQSK